VAPLVYQVYVRSFADANGDGYGDLAGLGSKLDYLQRLGVDTLWLSPIHPSPNVDWGYDVADYRAVHPDYGTLAEYEQLIRDARERDLDVWLDLVPNHTSDQHRWFTDKPEYYVWAKEIPNDWTSVFTGESAWQWHEGRQEYYLHQFAVEQPDLDWWNEDVRREFDEILRFWFDRGVRGLRIDVAHGLIKDRKLRNGSRYLRDRPEVHEIYARWQKIAAAYDPKPVLMGETYVPRRRMPAYWQHLDLVQNFEFVNAPFAIRALRPIVEYTMANIPANRRPIWFGSNHDHSRLATRWAGGDIAKHKAALFLLLTLPGAAILYQGDEFGLEDGVVPPDRVLDLAHPPRDPERTPLPWTRDGREWKSPWLPLGDTSRNVQDQLADPSSIVGHTRQLIGARKQLSGDSYETLPSPPGIWAYRRGDAVCRLNMTAKRRDGLEPWQGEIA
jgi:alpha-glucosidase